jgi:hypothetical protein
VGICVSGWVDLVEGLVGSAGLKVENSRFFKVRGPTAALRVPSFWLRCKECELGKDCECATVCSFLVFAYQALSIFLVFACQA